MQFVSCSVLLLLKKEVFQVVAVCSFHQQVATDLSSAEKDASPPLHAHQRLSVTFDAFFGCVCRICVSVCQSQLFNQKSRNECSSDFTLVLETPVENHRRSSTELLGRK